MEDEVQRRREGEVFRIADVSLRLESEVGDPGHFLPPAMRRFACPGGSDLLVRLVEEERAQSDPMKRFFPPHFGLHEREGRLVFEGKTRQQSELGYISIEDSVAVLGMPPLHGPWRMEEEIEAVREALRSFLAACLQVLLLERGGTMLHAAGVSVEGEAYAFVGHTGSGKTTLAGKFPPHEVLGDDLLALRPGNGGFLLYGTPWPGREGGAVSYGGDRLEAVFRLSPWSPRGLETIRAGDAVAGLMVDAPRLGWEEEESKLLDIFSSLVRRVPIFRMSVGLEDDVASILSSFRASREGEG